jgi:DNA-binding transcriptional MocR family regulator
LLPRRELALRLGLARNTVTAAFEQLIAEGYLEYGDARGERALRVAIAQHVQQFRGVTTDFHWRYVRRMTRVYGERRRALVALLEKGLPHGRFRLGTATTGLAARDELAENGLRVQPLSSFCVARTDCRGFVIGYGAAPLPEILAAAGMLLRVVNGHNTRE